MPKVSKKVYLFRVQSLINNHCISMFLMLSDYFKETKYSIIADQFYTVLLFEKKFAAICFNSFQYIKRLFCKMQFSWSV